MITVWGRRNSVNVQKVMWALGELELDYERHDMAGSFGATDAYRKLNPAGTVPTIQDGDLTLYESNVCVRYLARQYGVGGLCPADPAAAAIADQWMEWQTSTFGPVFFPVFFTMIRQPPEQFDAERVARGVQQSNQLLGLVEQRLAAQDFLAGDQLTMGDIPFGAFLYRYFTLDIERAELPGLRAYYDRLCSRKAYQKHVMIPFGSNSEEWLAEEKNNAGIQ